jgi:hypothetical protein
MKVMNLSRLCVTLVTGAALLGAAVRSQAQAPDPTDSYTNAFDAATPSSWIYWYGINPGNSAITWDATMDAATNLDSGSLQISLPFGPPANTNAQQVWFGTFGNRFGYDSSVRYNGNLFTNIEVDVFVDPSTPPSPAGDFGALQFSLVRSGTPSGGGPFPNSVTIPGNATNRWVHLGLPVPTGTDATGFDDPGVIGVVFRKVNFGGAYPQVPITMWLDNVTVKFSGVPPPPPPPPTMSVDRPVRGLNLFAGGGGDFDRQSIRTLGTDSGASYSWVGRGNTPVTYSFTVAGFPGPGHQGFQTHTYFVPTPLTGTGDNNIAPDYQEPNVLFLSLQSAANGSVNWVFRWKTNALASNGQFFGTGTATNDIAGVNAPYAQIGNPTALGTWTVTFVNDTNVTMTTPTGSSTNFFINPGLAALFPNPIYVYFGVQPNQTVPANKGQAAVLSRVKIQGTVDTIDDDFLTDTVLDTGNTWQVQATVPASIFIMPPESALFVNWTLANSSGFALQTNSVLNSTNSFPWSTNGLPDLLQLGLLKRTLLPSNSLPSGAQGFFRLSKPGF